MIRIYEVYIDIYFIQNVMTDMLLLILVLLLLKERIRWKRVAVASFAGGAGAVLILVSGIRFGVSYVLSVLVLDAVMVLICICHPASRNKIPFWRPAVGIIYLHGMMSAYGKLMECLVRLVGVRYVWFIVTVAIAGIVAFLVMYRNMANRKRIFDVTLTENGEDIALRALFDTGNLLHDPVSGKPVSVMEETDEIRQWMTKYPQKFRIIPYQSVGNEHGVLEGIVVERMMIRQEEGEVVKKEAVVALYKGKLSRDGTFQMILNHKLISA